jgi:O-acetylserine/cysteine efflux transporter
VNDKTATANPFTAKDLAAAAALNIMWGLNLVAVKMAVDLIEPLTAAWLRQVMVLIICLPFLKIMPGRMKPLLWLGALSGGLFYIIVNMSLAVSDNVPALAIAGQLGAPFSLILAVIIFKEKVHATRMIGMALAFAGVVLLVFDPAIVNEIPGLALSALASLIWAICSLIQRHLRGVPVMTIYAWVGLIGATILLPIAWAMEPEAMHGLKDVPLSTFGWVLFSALGSTVIGQGCMSYLLQRHPVSTVVPTTLLNPVISVLTAAWWFSTPLTPVMAIGGLIVLAGVAIVTIRTARAREEAGQ